MQNRRALFFFGLAIFFGIAAAFPARHLLENRASQATAPSVARGPVIVAPPDVAIGIALVGLQLDTGEWPRDYVPAGAFDDTSKLAGRVLRRPLARGEAVLESSLLPIGAQAGLPSVIESAKRAISV